MLIQAEHPPGSSPQDDSFGTAVGGGQPGQPGLYWAGAQEVGAFARKGPAPAELHAPGGAPEMVCPFCSAGSTCPDAEEEGGADDLQKTRRRRRVRKQRKVNRFGKWWKNFGYGGPKYCLRCSEARPDKRRRSLGLSCRDLVPYPCCVFLSQPCRNLVATLSRNLVAQPCRNLVAQPCRATLSRNLVVTLSQLGRSSATTSCARSPTRPTARARTRARTA
jgi:hypothetical protein